MIQPIFVPKYGKFDWFYGWFKFAMWNGWRKLKSWVEMNALCIVDEGHQWWVIAVDHTSKFKVILSILNLPLMVYNTENGAWLQKFPDKSQISGKKIVDIIVGNW